MVMKAKEARITKLFVARENVAEARLVKGIEVVGCEKLQDVIQFLNGGQQICSVNDENSSEDLPFYKDLDFKDVKGQSLLIEFLAIAAAGGHNFFDDWPTWSW
ncbi:MULTISPECIES: hypothetical protein [Heyndrickxia]|uniref:hypothetical protein n=1 Tax=Heyndrickxia TaxID=2837504 RepID=UPI000B2DACAD|nr:hypothetical protein [Heyndrickxia shackletonii]